MRFNYLQKTLKIKKTGENKMRLKEKIALITGAARGIGAANVKE